MQLSKDEEVSLRRKSLSICREYLGGDWVAVDEDDFVFLRITGGLSNYIFKCSRPSTVVEDGTAAAAIPTPSCVVLRVFGPHIADRCSEIIKDSIVSTLLAEWKIGPKVYAVKTSCRLEEFLEGQKLHVTEFRNPSVCSAVARVLAKFHGFDLPIGKQPRWLFETIQKYLKNIKRYDFRKDSDRNLYELLFKKFDLYKEYVDLRTTLDDVESPVVFCHNDTQPGNVLMIDGEVRLIDYEYSSYNFRGFDFGNMFCEFMFDYNHTKYPFFTFEFQQYPSVEFQEIILREYLAKLNKTSTKTVPEDQVNSILREAQYFSLASDFMWAAWAIYMSFDSRLDFGYMEYAACRVYSYCQKRQELLKLNQKKTTFVFPVAPDTTNHFMELLMSINRCKD